MSHSRPRSIFVTVIRRGIAFTLSCTVLTAMAIPALGPHGQGMTVPGGEDQGPAMLLPLSLPAPQFSRLSREHSTGRNRAIPQDWLSHRVKPGDTLLALLSSLEVGEADLQRLLAVEEAKVLDQLHPGQEIRLRLEPARGGEQTRRLVELILLEDELEGSRFIRIGDTFRPASYIPALDSYTGYRAGVIRHSFYRCAQRAGLSEELIDQLQEVFGWDIDLGDAQPGDRFAVAFEEHYRQGQKVAEGKLLAARFTHRGKTYQVVGYDDGRGEMAYFRPDGGGLRQSFLKSPLDFRRISSPFAPRRKHPVLGTHQAHEGVDYAAPIGTPVKATGEGEVIFAGRQRGYGITVTLRHPGGYTTLYAHLSKIAKGLSQGEQVQQGQVIGYVGQSGLASGPHLHYEFHVEDQPVDPLTVEVPGASVLAATLRGDFLARADELLPALERFEGLWLSLEQEGLLAGVGMERNPTGG